MDRRSFIGALAAPLCLALAVAPASGYDNPRRPVRRVLVRRRIRRHIVTRVVGGRSMWIVPVRLGVGWELQRGTRVVVVERIRVVERDGKRTELALVRNANGATEELAIHREDTAENARELEGSVLEASDTSTPSIEAGPAS